MRLLNKIYFLLLLACTCSLGYAQSPTITGIFASNNPFQTGETVEVNGSNLFTGGGPQLCDSLILTDTLTMDTFRISFSEYLFSSTSSAIRFILPPRLNCGTYSVQALSTIGGTCPGTPLYSNSSSTVPAYITVYDSVEFSYPGTAIFCVGEPNVSPIFGPNSDTTNLNFFTNPAVGGLFLSSATGELLIHNGSVGVHEIILETTNPGACQDRDSFTVEIKAMDSTSYTYPQSTYCPSADSAIPNPLPGIDTIFSIPALPWHDRDSGIIDVGNATPGTYNIYFQSQPDLCYFTDTAQITIQTLQVSSFSYDTAYCNNAGTATPLINFIPNTHIFSCATATVDQTTGVVDLVASNPGTHQVTCGPQFVGGCQAATTMPMKIRQLPDASFAYASDSICVNATTVSPISLADSTGIFRDTSNTLSISNVPLGELNIPGTIGNLNGPGPYYLEHLVDDGVCADSTGTFIYVLNTSNVNVNYPATRYCQSEGLVSPVFTTGNLGGTFVTDSSSTSILPTNALDPLTGVLTLANCPPGTYTINYVQSITGCTTTDNVITGLIIDEFIPADFGPLANNGTYCQDPNPTQIVPYTAPTQPSATWSFSVEINDSLVLGAVSTDFLNTALLPVGGFYDLNLVVDNGNCTDTLTHPIFIEAAGDASFQYLQDTVCGDADDPVPFMQGDSNGVFSFSHPTGLNLDLNPNNGVINLTGSDKGTDAYKIYYSVGTVCTAVDSDSIVILPANFAEFAYDTLNGGAQGLIEFCTFRDSVIVDTYVPGGIFSSNNPNCVINDSNGTIYLSQSVAGTYNISYQLDDSSACDARFSRSITILQADDSVSWGYVDSIFCPGDVSVAPVVSGLDSASFVFSTNGLAFTDTDGTINLVSSDSGFYYVTLQILGECPYTIVDSLTILPYVEPTFSYALPFYCTTDTHPRPQIDNPGGTFVAIDNSRDTISFIDPVTGQLNLDSVTSNAQSPFIISYTPSASCTYTDSVILTVNVGPDAASIGVTPSDTICEGETVEILAGGGDSYQFVINDTIFVNAGDSAFVNDFTISPTTAVGQTRISVFVGNTAACSRRLDTIIVTNPVPTVEFVNLPTTVNSGQNIAIDVLGLGTNGILFNWQALEVGDDNNINFAPSTGNEGPINNGATTFFESNVTLTDPTSPGQIAFVLTPFTTDCPGVPIRDTINLNPAGQEIFIPEVFTPNGDGVNDTWRIQLQQDIDPNNYTMLVFNRGGGLVYSMSPIDDLWDGDDLPDAVYWWKLIDNRTNQTELTGGVTIIRKRVDF